MDPFKLDMLLTPSPTLYGILINPDNLYTLNNQRWCASKERTATRKRSALGFGKHLTGSL